MKPPGKTSIASNGPLHLAAGYEAASPAGEPQIRPLAEVERIYIEAAIALCGGNIPRAALALQVSPSTIYRKKLRWEGADPAD